MRSIATTEDDPMLLRTGRFQRVPADIAVLIVWSGNEIRPMGDRSRVDGTRMGDECEGCLSEIVTLLKAFDRLLFVVFNHRALFGMPAGLVGHLTVKSVSCWTPWASQRRTAGR